MKPPNLFTMASTHQAQTPLRDISRQEKQAGIFPTLQSSLISIGKCFGDEFIVTFNKHKVTVRKKRQRLLKAIGIK